MGAFQALAGKLASKGMSSGEADAIAANAGRKKYGATAMAKGAATGKPAKDFAKGKRK